MAVREEISQGKRRLSSHLCRQAHHSYSWVSYYKRKYKQDSRGSKDKMSVSDDSWPLSSSSFQDGQSKINEIQLTKTSQPNSWMNQKNENLMTELAGKPSFTCKQPSLCKWPINLWEPDVPVYSHCLPSCPLMDWWMSPSILCLPSRNSLLS